MANDRALTLAKRPMHDVLRKKAPQLAKDLTKIIAAEVDTYGALPEDELQRDIVALVALNLHLVADTFENFRAPSSAQMAPLRAAAARGAQDLAPLSDILAAYHLGGRQAMMTLFANPDPEDYGDIVTAYSLLLDYNQSVSTEICGAYSQARESMRTQEQDARHAVVSALLDGERPMDAGVLAGVRLAPRYLVLTAAIGKHDDESEGKPFAPYAGRGKLDRIRNKLDEVTAEPVLSVLDTSGGLILVPAPETAMDWNDAGKLIAAVSQAAGAPVWMAGDLAGIEDVAAAAKLTQEVLDVVRTFGRVPGLYRLSDVLLEYQLTRPSQAMTALAGLLDPLEDSPDLLHTLRVHMENGLDRRRTAALLHIHPNTVDYRLRRASRLTGLDPVDPMQLQRIGAALMARRKIDNDGS